MKSILFAIIVFAYLFTGCKTSLDRPAAGTLIRIQNMTSQPMGEVISNNTSFGKVDSLSVSDYRSFGAMALPTAIIINGEDTAYAGVLNTDGPQAYVKEGKHTYQLSRQSDTNKRYFLLVTKD